MGYARPFSEIDSYLNELSDTPGCLIDTNFLLAATYENHAFSEDAQFLFEKLQEKRVPIFSTVTTRSEFLDIWRRITITEALMGMLAESATWKLTRIAQQELRKQKIWIDIQAKREEMPLLTDRRIKDCKEVFFPKNESGKSGWLEICQYFLSGMIDKSWDNLIETLGVTHLDLGKEDMQQYVFSKVEWTEMTKISEKTCLGTSDAMIVNMLKCSVFPFVISADYDMAYAILADSTEKTILIPNALYRNKIKKLKI